MEERDGERRSFLFRIPLSSVLSPFVPHRERRESSSFETISAARNSKTLAGQLATGEEQNFRNIEPVWRSKLPNAEKVARQVFTRQTADVAAR
jgi:hypothetical protein